MKEPDIPTNEKQRLQKLKEYKILDTPPEDAFDKIVKLASIICKTKIACIIFIDKDRQWIKSQTGNIDILASRKFSFCAHTINRPNEITVVRDVFDDNRFNKNPQVTDKPFFRFYAGVPLVVQNDYALGTICVYDDKPRVLNKQQLSALQLLSDCTLSELEHKRKKLEYEEAIAELEVIKKESKDQNIYFEEKQKVLEQMKEDEKKTSEINSRFVSIASHQFRTPLATIKSNAELIKLMIEKDVEAGKILNNPLSRIDKEINRMTEIMNDVLILDEVKFKNVSDKSACDIIKICDELATQFNELQDDGRQLEVIHEGEPVKLKVNESMFRHSISNLISNAFKYSSQGNPKLKTTSNNTGVSITISDKGIGIPLKEIDSLFQPFYRANNARAINGTGLGLSIVKEYVEANGGEIKVRSKENSGTEFRIDFGEETLLKP